MDEFAVNPGVCLWCDNPAVGSHHGCYHHDPDFADLRSERASRAAKSKGNAELRKLKAEVRDVIAEVKAGTRDRNDATAIFQGYRVLKDFIELERRIKETDELAADIQHMREQMERDY
jgi:hypothetical protein